MPAVASARRWPAVLAAAGVFLLVWLSCWYFKETLFEWLARPLIDAWPIDLNSQNNLADLESTSPFFTYVRLCSVPALVITFPLLTRTLLFRWRVSAAALIGLSYVTMALAFVNVRFVLLPQLVRWLAATATAFHSAGYGVSPYSTLRDYVRVVTDLFVAQALGAQLAVVLLFSTMTPRARVEAWRWPVLRLLGLGSSALLVGVGLTPPDPLLQLSFTAPLVALFGLATIAARVVGRNRPTAPDAQCN